MRVALVTGANRGIGRAVAEQLAVGGGRPVAEGAAGVTWAALLADDGPTGQFFRDRERIPW